MYSFLEDDNSEHKRVQGMSKNGIEKIIHNEYKDFLLNQKLFKHSINK